MSDRDSHRQFRKRPVVIVAIQWDGTNVDDILDFIRTKGSARRGTNGGILIDTLEGEMRADVGDWIIRGVKGECYPCKPDIFETTYEAVIRHAAAIQQEPPDKNCISLPDGSCASVEPCMHWEAPANPLPRRTTTALIEALRIRALALTGERWERTATRDIIKKAAQRLEEFTTRESRPDPLRKKLNELVRVWRNRAEPNFADPEATEETLAYWRGVKRCAAELEVALSPSGDCS